MHIPSIVEQGLKKIGNDIRTARIRRRVTMELMAKHATLSRTTLTKIENGDPSVAIGSYASVIFILGLFSDLDIGLFTDPRKDELGLKLELENLPKRIRMKKGDHDRAGSLESLTLRGA